ncbi:CotY/CotZ family spore coat protein [Aquibacillus salsiterrae]|uniref:CotY/CotZ family spore coat protein n=1 Tax=Aquibacillus salsiterrae TaxID=2950439 RepID=A0A9X3WFP4_9BACI|nr:CotY/CotZ family spore coat protein [Aquibacillus salsiterrae]MDC3416584.1 CotY/CotZ family spore coat protein [Aquibacillus salsiterrae]
MKHSVCLNNFICEKAKHIIDKQKEKVNKGLKHFCKPAYEATIPVILYPDDNKNQPLERFGNIGEIVEDEYGCFQTKFFRFEKVDEEECIAVLSLLRPLDEGGCLVDDICDVYRLERTRFCIKVDLSTISDVQLLSPVLVERQFPHPSPK